MGLLSHLEAGLCSRSFSVWRREGYFGFPVSPEQEGVGSLETVRVCSLGWAGSADDFPTDHPLRAFYHLPPAHMNIVRHVWCWASSFLAYPV